MLTTLLFLLLADAPAAQLAGVDLPDTATVGGQQLVLNGMGLREKYFINVYVGGLYLPARTSDADKAIAGDEPKRISMTFVYKQVTKDQLCESYDEGLEHISNAAAVRERFDTLCGMLEDVHSGDAIVFDYVPGTGTSINVKGTHRGTVKGADFMTALWTIYLGPKPPTAKFKRGLLGG